MREPDSACETSFGKGGQSFRLAQVAAGALALVVIVVLAASYMPRRLGSTLGESQQLEGALRAGSPEFEHYRGRVVVGEPEGTKARVTLSDKVVDLAATVRNETGRTIYGLEIRGALVGAGGETVRERTVLPVPEQQTRLEPGEAMDVHVQIPRLTPRAVEGSDAVLEVTGLILE